MAYLNLSIIISWEEYCGSFIMNMHVSALIYLLSGGPAGEGEKPGVTEPQLVTAPAQSTNIPLPSGGAIFMG